MENDRFFSFADAVYSRIRENGDRRIFHALYRVRCDLGLSAAEIPAEVEPPPGIDLHCRELAHAEGIVIIHPNWWGQPPAELKGWVDEPLIPCRPINDRQNGQTQIIR